MFEIVYRKQWWRFVCRIVNMTSILLKEHKVPFAYNFQPECSNMVCHVPWLKVVLQIAHVALILLREREVPCAIIQSCAPNRPYGFHIVEGTQGTVCL